MKMKLPTMSSMAVNRQATPADDSVQKWQTVSTTLKEIFDKEPITGSFQVLHKIVFSLATSHPQFEYDQLKKYLSTQITGQRDEIVQAMRFDRDAVLARIGTEYEKHSFATLKYSHLFLHLDRHWCPAQRVNGVVAVGRDIFGNLMLDEKLPIASAITDAFLAAVQRERNGEEAPAHSLLRSVCVMLLEVGLQTSIKKIIIDPFMAQSYHFFEAEASRLVASLPAPDYIAAYRDRVQLESQRCNTVFPSYKYTSLVLSAMSKTYIDARKSDILNQEGSGGLKSLCQNWKLKEIGIIFGAMSEISCGQEVVDFVCNHLLQEFMNIATPPKPENNSSEQEKKTSSSASSASKQITPAQGAKFVMDRCMLLLQRGKELISSAFVLQSGRPDKDAEKHVKKTSDTLLNTDDIISEQLALHHDHMLRSQPTEEDLEKCCENILAIFARLRNKDVFELTFKTYLARRMLTVTKSQTEEEHLERILINMLKRELGSAVTSKFEGMFHDKRTSEELCATFQRKLESRGEKLPLHLDVVVVTDGLWPQLPVLPLQVVPQELKRAIQLFTSFYRGMHKGRKIDFLWSQGTCDVRMQLPTTTKKCELSVPTFCLPVLMLFQGDQSYSVSSIAEEVGLTPQDTGRAVFSLSRNTASSTGVLSTDSPGVSPTTVVKFNTSWRSRTTKVKFLAAVAKNASGAAVANAATDGIGGKKAATETVQEDRKFRIDAAVVKIMKSRRMMNHRQLVNDVITFLSSSFNSTADQVKLRLENLIDREFLIRTDDGEGYIYKA